MDERDNYTDEAKLPRRAASQWKSTSHAGAALDQRADPAEPSRKLTQQFGVEQIREHGVKKFNAVAVFIVCVFVGQLLLWLLMEVLKRI